MRSRITLSFLCVFLFWNSVSLSAQTTSTLKKSQVKAVEISTSLLRSTDGSDEGLIDYSADGLQVGAFYSRLLSHQQTQSPQKIAIRIPVKIYLVGRVLRN
jgi:hypothetical protein